MKATEKSMSKKGLWIELLDSLFIMILCFATLLAAMLVTAGHILNFNYIIHYQTLTAVGLGLTLYLGFVLHYSDRELREMIHALYHDVAVSAPVEEVGRR